MSEDDARRAREVFDVNEGEAPWSESVHRRYFHESLDFIVRSLEPFRTAAADRPRVLYHYTTVNAAQEIITREELQATHYAYQNDPDELRYSVRLVQQAAAEVDANRAAQGKDARNSATHLVEAVTPGGPTERDVYTVAFSRLPDRLSMWRAYADDGRGYMLGFHAHDLDGNFLPPIEATSLADDAIYLSKVEYDRERQLDTARGIIGTACAMLDAAPSVDWSIYAPHLRSAIAHVFSVYMPYFKQSAFEEEEEWRIAWLANPDRAPDFRTGRYGLTPYMMIPMRLADGGPALASVTMGPRQDAATGAHALRQLLKRKEYRPINSEALDEFLGRAPSPGRPQAPPPPATVTIHKAKGSYR